MDGHPITALQCYFKVKVTDFADVTLKLLVFGDGLTLKTFFKEYALKNPSLNISA